MHPLRHAISRRGFIRGAAVAGAGAIAVSALSSCSPSTQANTSTPTVVDSGSATYVVGSGSIEGSYQQASEENGGTMQLKEAGTWNLALGCVLRPAEGTLRPFVAPVVGGSHMTEAGAFSLSTGKAATLVATPQAGGNFVVFDAQCSDSVFAWVELDLVTRAWKLFAAGIVSGALGTVSTLWEADSNYDPPRVRCSGSQVVWLVMPSSSGNRTTENSSCYLWQVGATSADEVVRSPGRFACPPAISDGMVTLTPRVTTDTSGRFYGITSYSLDNKLSSTVAQLVLPASVQPLYAVRMGDVFAFSIETSYGSSAGLLGGMGTYIGNGDDPFVALPREPAAEVSGKDGVYLVKTRASHLIVDTNKQTYSTLVAPNRALDYGDYPASSGTTSTFVTFATVKDVDTGYPSSVTVRAFSL